MRGRCWRRAAGSLVGGLGARGVRLPAPRTTDPLVDNALSLLTPFVVAVVAEAVRGSGVVAVVVTGLYLGHRLPTLMSAASRLQMGAFWRMVKFLLEGSSSSWSGCSCGEIVADLETPAGTVVAMTAPVLDRDHRAVPLDVPGTYLPRLVRRSGARPEPAAGRPTVVAWAGMRGVVTLATALALPIALAGGATTRATCSCGSRSRRSW